METRKITVHFYIQIVSVKAKNDIVLGIKESTKFIEHLTNNVRVIEVDDSNSNALVIYLGTYKSSIAFELDNNYAYRRFISTLNRINIVRSVEINDESGDFVYPKMKRPTPHETQHHNGQCEICGYTKYPQTDDYTDLHFKKLHFFNTLYCLENGFESDLNGDKIRTLADARLKKIIDEKIDVSLWDKLEIAIDLLKGEYWILRSLESNTPSFNDYVRGILIKNDNRYPLDLFKKADVYSLIELLYLQQDEDI